MKSRWLGSFAALILSAFATHASAAVLFENWPIAGNVGGNGIAVGNKTAVQFTLTEDAVVTGVNFGTWTFGNTVMAIDFGIGTAPLTYPINGSASVNNVFIGIEPTFNIFSVWSSSFSTGNIALSAGTYYLALQNAVVGDGTGSGFWDVTQSGPATYVNGGSIPTQSVSFQILGEPAVAAVPEPSTSAIMILGFAGGGFAAYRRGRNSVRWV